MIVLVNIHSNVETGLSIHFMSCCRAGRGQEELDVGIVRNTNFWWLWLLLLSLFYVFLVLAGFKQQLKK